MRRGVFHPFNSLFLPLFAPYGEEWALLEGGPVRRLRQPASMLALGWTATLDGAEVPIHPALVTAWGVEVPAGKHRVDFRYRTPALGAAMGLSLAGSAWEHGRSPPSGSGRGAFTLRHGVTWFFFMTTSSTT